MDLGRKSGILAGMVVVVSTVSDIRVVFIGKDIRKHFDSVEKFVLTSHRSLSVDGCSCDSGEHEANEEFHLGVKVVRMLRRSWQVAE